MQENHAMNTATIKHDEDFFAWTLQQADLLKHRRFAELDIEHLTEELESMGASDKRELMSRLTVLLTHLLKWQYQNDRRSVSWRLTIAEQRRAIRRLLDDSPSLKPLLLDAISSEYQHARDDAVYETALPKSAFPVESPYSAEQITDSEFWPD
jgi:hypothetical protein